MRTFAAVTTFHNKGYAKYGRNMINSFIKHWPKNVKLYVYYEGNKPDLEAPNVEYRDLLKTCPDLVNFKNRHKDNKRAHGEIKWFPDRLEKNPTGWGFRWDAVRFSHKSYAITHAGLNVPTDVLFWVDADSLTFRDIPADFLESLLPPDKYCCFLGREPVKYTETGFIGFDTKHAYHKIFMERWKQHYDQDLIFNLKEWHDCEVFDTVRHELEAQGQIFNYNLSDTVFPGKIGKVLGHPFINSVLGDYMDHLKGPRKDHGSSREKELKVKRFEGYWKGKNWSK